MKHLKKIKITLFLFWLIFYSCDLAVWDGDPKMPPNVLNQKDSLAVRAILDQNELYSTNVTNVINLQNSMVGSMTLKSLPLTQLVLTHTFNSLLNGFRINVFNCPVDTIVIEDSIQKNLTIAMNDTKIECIPDNISLLKGNLLFYLSRNKISRIPDEIMKCNVSYINVESNNLCSVSDTLNNWIIKNSRNPDWKASQICN